MPKRRASPAHTPARKRPLRGRTRPFWAIRCFTGRCSAIPSVCPMVVTGIRQVMRRTLVAAIFLGLVAASGAQAAPELGISDRLQDRRYIASSERAYVVGFEDGRFYANGWHITGEMGGVWTPPLKLVDGVWFGVDDQWIGPATEFRSGWGYTEMDLPATAGLELQRSDFAPDGGRAALFGLRIRNPGAAARTVTVKVDAHSELLGAYPWGFDGVTPNASDNLTDSAAF